MAELEPQLDTLFDDVYVLGVNPLRDMEGPWMKRITRGLSCQTPQNGQCCSTIL